MRAKFLPNCLILLFESKIKTLMKSWFSAWMSVLSLYTFSLRGGLSSCLSPFSSSFLSFLLLSLRLVSWKRNKETHLRKIAVRKNCILCYLCGCLIESSSWRKGCMVSLSSFTFLYRSTWKRLKTTFSLSFTFSPPEGLSSFLFSASFCLWAAASIPLCLVCWEEDIYSLKKIAVGESLYRFYLCNCLVELCSWGKSQVVLNVFKNSQWRLHCVGLVSHLWVLTLSSPTMHLSKHLRKTSRQRFL